MTSGVVRHLPAALLIAWTSVGALPARDARAACNLIPPAQTLFRGALGSTDRPFAAPGDFVEVDVRQTLCDGASADFTALADDHVVTLVFSPLAIGPRRVLTTSPCAGLTAELATCGSFAKSAAAADQDAASTRLTVTVGGQCFTHVATKKTD